MLKFECVWIVMHILVFVCQFLKWIDFLVWSFKINSHKYVSNHAITMKYRLRGELIFFLYFVSMRGNFYKSLRNYFSLIFKNLFNAANSPSKWKKIVDTKERLLRHAHWWIDQRIGWKQKLYTKRDIIHNQKLQKVYVY